MKKMWLIIILMILVLITVGFFFFYNSYPRFPSCTGEKTIHNLNSEIGSESEAVQIVDEIISLYGIETTNKSHSVRVDKNLLSDDFSVSTKLCVDIKERKRLRNLEDGRNLKSELNRDDFESDTYGVLCRSLNFRIKDKEVSVLVGQPC